MKKILTLFCFTLMSASYIIAQPCVSGFDPLNPSTVINKSMHDNIDITGTLHASYLIEIFDPSNGSLYASTSTNSNPNTLRYSDITGLMFSDNFNHPFYHIQVTGYSATNQGGAAFQGCIASIDIGFNETIRSNHCGNMNKSYSAGLNLDISASDLQSYAAIRVHYLDPLGNDMGYHTITSGSYPRYSDQLSSGNHLAIGVNYTVAPEALSQNGDKEIGASCSIGFAFRGKLKTSHCNQDVRYQASCRPDASSNYVHYGNTKFEFYDGTTLIEEMEIANGNWKDYSDQMDLGTHLEFNKTYTVKLYVQDKSGNSIWHLSLLPTCSVNLVYEGNLKNDHCQPLSSSSYTNITADIKTNTESNNSSYNQYKFSFYDMTSTATNTIIANATPAVTVYSPSATTYSAAGLNQNTVYRVHVEAQDLSSNGNWDSPFDPSVNTLVDLCQIGFSSCASTVINDNSTINHMYGAPGGTYVCQAYVTLSPSGGSPNYSYSWSPNHYAQYSPNSFMINPNTNYTLTITDNNGCTSLFTYTTGSGQSGCVPATLKTDNKLSLDESDMLSSSSIYPNPTSDIINIQFPDEVSGEMVLMDIYGKMVDRRVISKTANDQIDMRDLPSGMYLLNINVNGLNETHRVVKN